jgi:hypothetical protein
MSSGMRGRRRTVAVWAALWLAAPAGAQLAVVGWSLHQYDGGPPLAAGFRFGRGETVFVRFRIQGFARSPDARIDLACTLEAVDGRGVRLAPSEQKQIQTELTPEDKDWLPVVRHEFVIPPLADPGAYRVLISVEDRLAGRRAKAEIPFQVRGPSVEPSDTLVARNFRFLKGEDGPLVEGRPIYARGEMLWARFEITGYRIGEGNRIEVEYGLSVLGPTGKEIYSEPQAALEKSTPFYPHRYLPGLLSLNLEKAEPGDYTLVLKIRDRVGGQECESSHPFQVR